MCLSRHLRSVVSGIPVSLCRPSMEFPAFSYLLMNSSLSKNHFRCGTNNLLGWASAAPIRCVRVGNFPAKGLNVIYDDWRK